MGLRFWQLKATVIYLLVVTSFARIEPRTCNRENCFERFEGEDFRNSNADVTWLQENEIYGIPINADDGFDNTTPTYHSRKYINKPQRIAGINEPENQYELHKKFTRPTLERIKDRSNAAIDSTDRESRISDFLQWKIIDESRVANRWAYEREDRQRFTDLDYQNDRLETIRSLEDHLERRTDSKSGENQPREGTDRFIDCDERSETALRTEFQKERWEQVYRLNGHEAQSSAAERRNDREDRRDLSRSIDDREESKQFDDREELRVITMNTDDRQERHEVTLTYKKREGSDDSVEHLERTQRSNDADSNRLIDRQMFPATTRTIDYRKLQPEKSQHVNDREERQVMVRVEGHKEVRKRFIDREVQSAAIRLEITRATNGLEDQRKLTRRFNDRNERFEIREQFSGRGERRNIAERQGKLKVNIHERLEEQLKITQRLDDHQEWRETTLRSETQQELNRPGPEERSVSVRESNDRLERQGITETINNRNDQRKLIHTFMNRRERRQALNIEKSENRRELGEHPETNVRDNNIEKERELYQRISERQQGLIKRVYIREAVGRTDNSLMKLAREELKAITRIIEDHEVRRALSRSGGSRRFNGNEELAAITLSVDDHEERREDAVRTCNPDERQKLISARFADRKKLEAAQCTKNSEGQREINQRIPNTRSNDREERQVVVHRFNDRGGQYIASNLVERLPSSERDELLSTSSTTSGRKKHREAIARDNNREERRVEVETFNNREERYEATRWFDDRQERPQRDELPAVTRSIDGRKTQLDAITLTENGEHRRSAATRSLDNGQKRGRLCTLAESIDGRKQKREVTTRIETREERRVAANILDDRKDRNVATSRFVNRQESPEREDIPTIDRRHKQREATRRTENKEERRSVATRRLDDRQESLELRSIDVSIDGRKENREATTRVEIREERRVVANILDDRKDRNVATSRFVNRQESPEREDIPTIDRRRKQREATRRTENKEERRSVATRRMDDRQESVKLGSIDVSIDGRKEKREATTRVEIREERRVVANILDDRKDRNVATSRFVNRQKSTEREDIRAIDRRHKQRVANAHTENREERRSVATRRMDDRQESVKLGSIDESIGGRKEKRGATTRVETREESRVEANILKDRNVAGSRFLNRKLETIRIYDSIDELRNLEEERRNSKRLSELYVEGLVALQFEESNMQSNIHQIRKERRRIGDEDRSPPERLHRQIRTTKEIENWQERYIIYDMKPSRETNKNANMKRGCILLGQIAILTLALLRTLHINDFAMTKGIRQHIGSGSSHLIGF